MSVAPCPRCHDDVTVPSNAPPEAIVQCPLCREEFELEEVQRGMPPALVVIKMPETVAAAAGVGASLSESAPDFAFDTEGDGDDYTFAAEPDEEASDAPAFAFDSNDADSDSTATATASRGAIKATPRKKKKQANPAVEIAKVAFGGAGGVLIAIVLLWYLPGRYGQDILGIGPTIGSIPGLGVIVPAKFRGNAMPNEGDSTQNNPPELDPVLKVQDDGTPKRSIADYARAAANENQNNNAGNGGNNRNGGNQQKPRNNQNGNNRNGNNSGSNTEENGEETPSVDPIELPPVDFANIETDPNEVTSNDEGPRAPGGQALGPIDPPAIAPDELVASVAAVNQGVVAYNEQVSTGVRGQPLKDAASRHYDEFAKMAQAITFVDQTAEKAIGEAAAAEQLVREVASSPQKLSFMQFFAANDLASHDTPNKGIMLVGKVVAVGKVDRLFSTTIEITPPTGKPVQVKVLGTKDPNDIVSGFGTDRQVGILGALVPDPSTNIRGYKGNEPAVVWGGYFVVLGDDV